MTTQHSNLGASSAHRWLVCGQSVQFTGNEPPEVESTAAREGTIAHELAAYCLQNGLYDATDAFDSVPALDDLKRLFPDNAEAKRDEMARGVQLYLDTVYAEMGSTADPHAASALFVETRFDLDVAPGMFGTCDGVVANMMRRHMTVFDFKYGFVGVDAVGNAQGQYYALGAVAALAHMKPRTVDIVIVQPRALGQQVKRWSIDRVDLLDFRSVLADGVARTRDPNTPYVPGDHCKYCRRKVVCPSLEAAAQEAARSDFATDAKRGISPEEMGRRLKLADDAGMWIEALREYAKAEAKQGRMPAGYKHVYGREGNREWKADVGAAQLTAAVGNLCPAVETRVRSPAQIEKDIGKKEFAARCSPLITRKPPGIVMVPVSDPRPEATANDVAGF